MMSDSAKQPDQPRDPRGTYHSGPFPEQEQKQPGLTAPMDPQPDHGELSYEGSDKLEGKAALITGGDSGIGRPWPLPSHVKAQTSPSPTFPRRNRTRRIRRSGSARPAGVHFSCQATAAVR